MNTTDFFGHHSPFDLIEQYGSPLYIYNEHILRTRCKELKAAFPAPLFAVNYSAKANTNPHLLKIIHSERFHVDAMSPGEILMEMEAGFTPSDILFISNNVSAEEMQFAIDRNITISVDSLSQLEQYGRLNPGGHVAFRFNPGIGDGCHGNLITGGKGTKFGIPLEDVPALRQILDTHNLTLTGINQHIGSNFTEGNVYLEAARRMLAVVEQFDTVQFADFGGGFGINYDANDTERRINITAFGKKLTELVTNWKNRTGWTGTFKIEPGRYVVAECGQLVGTVHAEKTNYDQHFIGTDIGFNVLHRPVMYDAWHEIAVLPKNRAKPTKMITASVVGNICETGDYVAKDRMLNSATPGDLIVVTHAGAYAHIMSSNYNMRLRPAEVLLEYSGKNRLIRKRDTHEELLAKYRMG